MSERKSLGVGPMEFADGTVLRRYGGDAIGPPGSPFESSGIRLNSSTWWLSLELPTGEVEWWAAERSWSKAYAAVDGAENADEVRVGLEMAHATRWVA
jgi:hypothetical protein